MNRRQPYNYANYVYSLRPCTAYILSDSCFEWILISFWPTYAISRYSHIIRKHITYKVFVLTSADKDFEIVTNWKLKIALWLRFICGSKWTERPETVLYNYRDRCAYGEIARMCYYYYGNTSLHKFHVVVLIFDSIFKSEVLKGVKEKIFK